MMVGSKLTICKGHIMIKDMNRAKAKIMAMAMDSIILEKGM